MRSMRRVVVLWVAVLLMALVAAACGGEDDATESVADAVSSATAAAGGETTGATDTAAAGGGEPIKIGLVTDVGGLNDKGFNELANTGLQQAASELGAEVEVRESKLDTDYVPNLQYFAQNQYDMVVAVGFLMGEAVGKVAEQFPDAKFSIIDFSA